MDGKALHRWVMGSSIGAVTIFIVSIAGSVLLKPDYHIFMNYLSSLGTGEISGPLFSTGMVVTAALLAVYFWALRPILGIRQRVTLGTASGLVSAAGLAGVGIFPVGVDPYHTLAAALFFLASALAVVLFHLVVVEERISTPISRASGIAYVALGVLFVLLERPWVENLAVVAFGIWLLAMVEVTGRYLRRRPVQRPDPGAPVPFTRSG
ncbi:MAG: DUF998 domain-containing protein [Methanomicrobiales archaeon]|nr:DUF998 domain-containing protein [Methanomicrobiales archaeon]